MIKQLKIQEKWLCPFQIFCVERHKFEFLELVQNRLDIIFANEQEILSLISTNKFKEAISFCKQLNKNIIITRGEKGSIAINGKNIFECAAKKKLEIKDLTGAGGLFAAGYLHGIVNNLSVEESLSIGTELSSKIIQKIGGRI